jgi:hypothetical protein
VVVVCVKSVLRVKLLLVWQTLFCHRQVVEMKERLASVLKELTVMKTSATNDRADTTKQFAEISKRVAATEIRKDDEKGPNPNVHTQMNQAPGGGQRHRHRPRAATTTTHHAPPPHHAPHRTATATAHTMHLHHHTTGTATATTH